MRWLAATICILFLAACGESPRSAASDTRSTPVSLQLNWYPEAEHGGFYEALLRGYYAEAGLDVTIRPGGPNIPIVQIVGSGQADFGVCNADDVVTGRSRGANLVALLAPLQTSPRCIMVHAGSGIGSFEDLKDMTLAMEPSSAFAQYVAARVPLSNVRIVRYAGVAPFVANENYAMQGYVFSEPFVARKAGADPKSLMVADLGFDPYTSLLVTSDEYIARGNDAVVRGIARASRRGWEDYLADPAATNAYIHGLNEEMGLDTLEYGVGRIRELAESDAVAEHGFGWMTPERWQTITEQLESLGTIDEGTVDAAKTFTVEYLSE